MKNLLSKLLAGVLVFACIWNFLSPVNAFASVSSWHKSVSIHPNWDGEFSTDAFKRSVDNAAAMGANYVTLIIPLYQSDKFSADVYKGGNTPTDESLISAITYAHSKGLKVMLKPHLENQNFEWRANINPQNRTAWFASYGNFLAAYAKIAQDYGVEDFCIGAELISMASAFVNSSNTQNWKNLISKIRGVYSGRLTYSANWGPPGDSFVDEKNNIQFWDSLDYIGVAAYFNLYGDNSVQNLKNQWEGYRQADLEPLSQRWNKPIVFTEIGYRSVEGAHLQPWNYGMGGGYSPETQSNAYEAMFSFWSAHGFMNGVHLWDWKPYPNAGGEGNTDYTPQNKPAENVIKTWFSQGGPAAPEEPAPVFSVTNSSVSPSPVAPGQAANIKTTVANSGGAAGNIIVDMEIYNAQNQKIFQQYFSGQAFTAGQSREYGINWQVPSGNAEYKLKVGIFNFNWSENYVWVDNALALSPSGAAAPPPGGGQGSIDIWWPGEGVAVSGIQPFKALLTNWGVSQYNMYWQADGGGLVLMPTDLTDYPHKEFMVDLSGWNWKGSGPYNINFVAKDLSGNILSQRSAEIFVYK